MNYIIVISIIICFLVIITFLRGYFKEKFTQDTCLFVTQVSIRKCG